MTSWFNSLIIFLVLSIIMLMIVGAASYFGGARIIIPILMTGSLFGLTIWLLSEPIVVAYSKARAPDPEKHANFIKIVDELSQQFRWWIKPRLYLLEMKIKNPEKEEPIPIPNAAAFGIGFLGQYAIGITEPIYNLLSYDELKAVIAHEIGHIRSKDVGLMTTFVIITNGAEQIAKLFTSGKTALGKSPVSMVLGLIMYVVAKLFFPIGRSALSQEREFNADALATLYTGTPEHLISGLKKMQEWSIANLPEKPHHILDDVLISHPKMDNRLETLQSYQTEKETT